MPKRKRRTAKQKEQTQKMRGRGLDTKAKKRRSGAKSASTPSSVKTSPATTRITGRKYCVHNLCNNVVSAEFPMARISSKLGQSAKRGVIEALGLPHTHKLKSDSRICSAHLRQGETGPVAAGHQIRPFADDPVCTGKVGARSGAGAQWLQQHNKSTTFGRNRRDNVDECTTSEDNLMAKYAAIVEENKRLRKQVSGYKSMHKKTVRMLSYAWLTEDADRCRRWAFLTPVEIDEILQSLELCGAEGMYDTLAGTYKTRQYDWRDAFCLVLCRLYSMRVYRKLQDMTKVNPTSMRKAFKIATVVAAAIARRTCLRPPDREYVERKRTPMLGPGSGFEAVVMQADGMKVRTMCPSVTDVHRLVHSAHAHMACAQTTITIYANNEVGPSTRFYGGSYGESVCVKDDATNLLAYIKAGDVFVTDKGYYLRDLLQQRYGAHHLKPTEMAGGSGAGMTPEQCARSQVIAQIRSVTERVVLLFKRFDIFGGTAVHMNEWHMMDEYKDIITMLIMKKGPLPDHLRPKREPTSMFVVSTIV